jgi:hypothetical protein
LNQLLHVQLQQPRHVQRQKNNLQIMRSTILLFLLVCNSSFAQIYIGGQLSLNRKIPSVNYTPVVPEFSNSNEFGLTGIYCKNNESKFKAIISTSDDRFNNDQDTSYFNSYVGVCTMLSVLNFEMNSGIKHCLFFGCYAEGLYKFGTAEPGEEKFIISNNIGTNIKFGIAAEYSLQSIKNKWLSSVSLYTRSDFSRLTISKNNIVMRDELIKVGINLNLNRQISNH